MDPGNGAKSKCGMGPGGGDGLFYSSIEMESLFHFHRFCVSKKQRCEFRSVKLWYFIKLSTYGSIQNYLKFV